MVDSRQEESVMERRIATRFAMLFLSFLLVSFSLLSLAIVNDRFVEPYTAAVARVSGATLRALGQPVFQEGTRLEGERFAVNIRNGCNGVEALVIFLAAVMASPATRRARG